jgi:glycosyltransferase involved in cell wall biosynthesis
LSLSVLIPVYNRDVTLLVSSLASLLTKEKILSEILLLDDASDEEYVNSNQKLVEADFIFHYRNPTNLGRSGARNILGETARYDHLLYLDCDVKIIRPDFITKYNDRMKAGIGVCCGGIAYDENEPSDVKYKLHWKYGAQRETKAGFLSSNLLIRKDLFFKTDLEENLEQYGHEDTLWHIQLKSQGIDIKIIDNPVLHEGLEETPIYIKKSLQAVGNLITVERIVNSQLLAKHVKLFDWYQKLDSLYLTRIIEKGEAIFHKRIIENLLSYDPSLRYFDWLRLAHLIRMKKSDAKNKISV